MKQQTPFSPPSPPSRACGCGSHCAPAVAPAQEHLGAEHAHEHDHGHGALPSWLRCGAALALAAAAEVAHLWQQEGLGMALALGAIALSGWGVYRAGWQDVLRLRLGIQALMAVAVT